MNSNMKHCLFDWDGCLVNSLPMWLNGMRKGIEHFGCSATNDILSQGFQGWDVFIQMGISDFETFTKVVYAYVNSQLQYIEFNPKVIQTLNTLKQNNCKLGIVSSSESEKIETVLKRYGMLNFFDCIIGRTDVDKLKPHSQPLEKAMRLMQIKPYNTLMIGDSAVDVQAANNAGVTSVWYNPKHNQMYQQHINKQTLNPTIEIDSFDKLLKVV